MKRATRRTCMAPPRPSTSTACRRAPALSLAARKLVPLLSVHAHCMVSYSDPPRRWTAPRRGGRLSEAFLAADALVVEAPPGDIARRVDFVGQAGVLSPVATDRRLAVGAGSVGDEVLLGSAVDPQHVVHALTVTRIRCLV